MKRRRDYASTVSDAACVGFSRGHPCVDTGSASAEQEITEIEKIVVTPRRRSTEDLIAVLSGLNSATNGAFAPPTIRGIGTAVTAAGGSIADALPRTFGVRGELRF
jgi:hypothetical protein